MKRNSFLDQLPGNEILRQSALVDVNVSIHDLELHLGKAQISEQPGVHQEQLVQLPIFCSAERKLKFGSVERIIGISGIDKPLCRVSILSPGSSLLQIGQDVTFVLFGKLRRDCIKDTFYKDFLLPRILGNIIAVIFFA